MLIETFRSITTAARKVFSSWRSMTLLAIVYAALLAALYLFMAIREASIVQVALTFGLAVAAFILFFLLQAIVVRRIAGTKDDDFAEPGIGGLFKSSMVDLGKLVLISVPLIGVAILLAYLLNKAQNYFGAGTAAAGEAIDPIARPRSRNAAPAPINWRVAILSSLRYLSFGLLLPLATIHLWLAAVRDGLGPAVRRIGTHLARAFAPHSVLIYFIGFVIFAVLPYFLLFKNTPHSRAWVEISFLVVRLITVFVLTLFGWVMTVWALSLSSLTPSPSPSPTPASPIEPARKVA